jgi:transposase InsO family protein
MKMLRCLSQDCPGENAAINTAVLLVFEDHGIPLLRVLTDRGTEYCGAREHHEYQLYLAVEDIDHSKTKARSPQSNAICERFHKTVLDEFYRIAFRRKIYNTLDELQADLDTWLKQYNEERVPSGKYCFGKTPMQTLRDSMPLVKDKMLNNNVQANVA